MYSLLKYILHLHVLNVILQVGQFQDDRQSSRLRTLVAHYTPVQVWIIFVSGVLSHPWWSSVKQ